MRLLVAVTVLSLPWMSKQQSDGSAAEGIKSFFAEIGFAASCVSQTLSLCENSHASNPFTKVLQEFESVRRALEDKTKDKQQARNCADLFDKGDRESGVQTVYPSRCDSCEKSPVSVYCDQTSDGGGWTVIQHREALPQREDFFRGWTEYRLGFGNLTGEFWLGLENIHALVKDKLMELKVDLEDFEGNKRVARYDFFYVSDASDKFRLEIGGCTGDAGDSLKYHNGMQFSTKDQDNDVKDSGSCAMERKGAWWYRECTESNLNGHSYEGKHKSWEDGINWQHFKGSHYSLKETTMSIRPRFCH